MQGVEAEQSRPRLFDGLFNPTVGKGKGACAVINDHHAGAIGAGAFQSRLDGVGKPVFCGLIDDGHGRGGPLLFGQRQALCEQGGKVEYQHGLAFARIALQDGYFPCRDIGIPQPLHFGFLDGIHRDQLHVFTQFQSSFVIFCIQKRQGVVPELPPLTSATTGVMLLKRRQPDSPATALNKFCSIRTLNGVYTEFGIDPVFTE